MFTLLLLRGQIFPKAHSARKGGPSSVRQWARATKTSEIPNEPPKILMPVHGHKLSRQHFISIRTHSFCFRKVNNSMPLFIISYLHWELLFEAHCGFNVYRDLSNGLKLQKTPVPVFSKLQNQTCTCTDWGGE